MVPYAGRVPICQFPDMVDANIPLLQHRIIEMQYLLVNIAHKKREGLAILPLYHDGWTSFDQSGTNIRAARTVQSNQEVLETGHARKMLAHSSQDLLNLCSSW